jgi:hypothetical protein
LKQTSRVNQCGDTPKGVARYCLEPLIFKTVLFTHPLDHAMLNKQAVEGIVVSFGSRIIKQMLNCDVHHTCKRKCLRYDIQTKVMEERPRTTILSTSLCPASLYFPNNKLNTSKPQNLRLYLKTVM